MALIYSKAASTKSSMRRASLLTNPAAPAWWLASSMFSPPRRCWETPTMRTSWSTTGCASCANDCSPKTVLFTPPTRCKVPERTRDSTCTSRRSACSRSARSTSSTVHATLICRRWRHPTIGFQESQPPTAPLRSNPHMHLLEAALCWQRASGGHDNSWNALVHQLVTLCLTRLVQPDSGLVTELFDLDWRPLPGPDAGLAEPGHQFEWGWLLLNWARQEPGHPLAAQARQAAVRMS